MADINAHESTVTTHTHITHSHKPLLASFGPLPRTLFPPTYFPANTIQKLVPPKPHKNFPAKTKPTCLSRVYSIATSLLRPP